MSGESTRLWRCPGCNRVLLERSEEYARKRYQSRIVEAAGQAVQFVTEAMWPAYLASLRRCRCGSRKRMRPVLGSALHGQLDLHLDAVVLQ